MYTQRHAPVQSRRDAWVEINLGAIESNARQIGQWVPKSVELMAIVKADAYGHGAAMVLDTLGASGVSMAGVASMDEAIHIRQAGIKMPVLVIGVVPDWAVQYATDYNVQLTIFAHHHLESLAKAYQQDGKPFQVHIKVDTGMHRIGVQWEAAADFIRHCQSLPYVKVEGVFSHLADSHDLALTSQQISRWQQVLQQLEVLPRYVHVANSGHTLCPDTFQPDVIQTTPKENLVRVGIGFLGYGNHPQQHNFALKPAMSLKARIIHLQTVPPNTGISYSHRYRTPPGEPSLIATVPLGYADGVPRVLSSRIEGFLNGVRVPQVGNITMDQMMFNVSQVPQARVGETITLVGAANASGSAPLGQTDAIWLDDWAAKVGTIEYELMCALRVRLPKTYTR